MKYLYTLLAAILFTNIFFASSVSAFDSNLKATIQIKDPAKPVFVLRNTGTQPCQVIDSSLGTVAITKVTQDDKTIKPVPIQVRFDDGLEKFLTQHLKTLQPNESVELPLDVDTTKSDTGLQSITWSKLTGPFGIVYPLQKDQPYTLEANYVAPIAITGDTPSCGTATTGPAAFDFHQYLKYIYIAVGILVLILIIYFLIRSKKPKKKGKKLWPFLLILATMLMFPTQAIKAEYSIPTEATPTFDGCMALFDRYPDITGPILDAIDSQQIYIFVNNSHINDTVDWPPDGSYHIRWDYTSEYDYETDDGSPNPSTPCDRLFHELFHVYDLIHNHNPRTYCAGSEVETHEVDATRMQNRLRAAMGLPPRTYYDGHRIPPGDCAAPAPPPPAPSCSSLGCGLGWGEPHLRTFDLFPYDFQAAGEFIYTKDPKGDFEVQARLEPWATSRFVTMNSAIAMKVNNDKVEVRIKDYPIEMLVNGKKTDLKNQKLDGGGSISTLNGNHVVVTWPDKSVVTVNFYSTFGLDLYVEPSDARKGQLVGLLGNDNGEGNDDLVVQGTNQKVDPEFDQLYPKFADSWRITNQTSLFTYDSGKNTNSYTDKTFPDKYTVPADLPNAEVAQQVCSQLEITDKTVLQNCILDVGLTGRPEFAYAAKQIQKSYPAAPDEQTSNGNITPGGNAVTINITKPDTNSELTFDGVADKKYKVEITNSTLPDQCGGIGAEDQSGASVGNACLLSGTASFETLPLPASGKYKITVDPVDNALGKATVKITELH